MAAKNNALASTGIICVEPGSTNTVPGRAQFSLDIRAEDDSSLMKLEEQLKRDFYKIAKGASVDGVYYGGAPGRPCSAEWTLDAPSSAVKFDSCCVDCVKKSAEGLLGYDLLQDMISGAGHDSVFTSKRCPTSMIFVPCLDGISHNPAEYCAPEDCGVGAQVLMDSVLRYDTYRSTSTSE